MRIFVSYRSVDRPLVTELMTDLEAMGHTVWMDKKNLQAGQKWWDEIIQNLQAADLVIFALTPDAAESRPCQLEYTYAEQLLKPIIPVKLREGVNYALLHHIIQEREILDYLKRDKADYQRLNIAIMNLPPALPLPDPLPKPPTAPLSPLVSVRDELDSGDLSYERQVVVFNQLKGFLTDADNAADAALLMLKLKNHPMLFAAVMRDIDEALARHEAQKIAPVIPVKAPLPLAPEMDGETQKVNYVTLLHELLNEPEISPEQQQSLFQQLRGMLANPSQAMDAEYLLRKLSLHSAVNADLRQDIQLLLMPATQPAAAEPEPEVQQGVATTQSNPAAAISNMLANARPQPKELPAVDWGDHRETILQEMVASMHDGSWWQGRFAITAQHILFKPDSYQSRYHKTPFQLALRDILRMDKAFKWLNPSVEVTLQNGEKHYFTFGVGGGLYYRNREEIIDLIRQHMQ